MKLLMRDCAREALKAYEDKKKVLEEKESRGIKLDFEGARIWKDFCNAIEKALLDCDRDSDYASVGLAYMGYVTARNAYVKSIRGGFDIDLAHTAFIKKNELKKTIRGLVGNNRTIRI